MDILKFTKELMSRLAPGQKTDGGKLKEDFKIHNGVYMLDGIKRKVTWDLHAFDNHVFDSLGPARAKIKGLLDKGHLILKENNKKAGEYFARAMDMQDELFALHCLDKSVIPGNAMLNEGMNALTNLWAGGGDTAYNNANAELGTGTSTIPAIGGTDQTFTQNSSTVTGVATDFGATGPSVGDWIRAATDTKLYRVTAVGSTTSLTIECFFEAATESNVTGFWIDVTGTDLLGTPVWIGMDGGFPTFGSNQNIIWQSIFATGDGNQLWSNFGVRNGSGANINANIKYQDEGTKLISQTRTLKLQIDLS